MTPRLIALDMDGTLLDAAGRIPEKFWPLSERAAQHGTVIAPASGRQLATLQELFSPRPPEAYIAENGAVVSVRGEIVSTTPIDDAAVRAVIAASASLDATLVVCHPQAAHLTAATDEEVASEIAKYYRSRVTVDDLSEAVDGNVVKLALFTRHNAESHLAPALRDAAPDLNVSVSGKHWVDLMHPSANKGVALTALATALGAAPETTVAFGDYLNDYELLDAAGTAYAMDNAHPDIKAIADKIAPPNTEHGVITELEALLPAQAE